MHSPQRAPSAQPVASAAAAADAAAACPEPAAAPASACAEQLRIARARTLGLFDDLPADALLGPRLPVVNPPLWELGHLGWFQERWLLRARPDGTLAPSLLPGADALYDSAAVAHATRWDLPLPGPDATRDYLSQVLDRTLERLDGAASTMPVGADGRDLSFHAVVCAQHEQMHAEAFSYSRQTLAYPAAGAQLALAPSGLAAVAAGVGATGDAAIEGGLFRLGAEQGEGFVFDNEKWAHPVKVAPFALARRATSVAEYAAFVDEGGYAQRRWWSDEGWAWRTAAQADAPVYWRRKLGVQGWEVRCNDAWRPLLPDAPMLHVNAHEAEAWCRWAGRRLPSEAEWECAAAGGGGAAARRHPWGDTPPSRARANLWFPGAEGALAPVDALAGGDSLQGCRQLTGNVWEWTASTFEPYPGFTPDPYREYSEPWFGSHRVLRGGCFATAASLIRNSWRNFYTPDRRDVYAGFRSCALEPR